MNAPQTSSDATTLDSAPLGGNDKFTGLLLKGTGKRHVGVVLMHGRKLHPDAAVVGPLRRSLSAMGYMTLSIQNPVPKPTDEFPDYVEDLNGRNYVFPEAFARIRAALRHLKGLGTQEAVLLGFSMGARMQSAYLAKEKESDVPIKAFIALSNGVNGIGPLNSTNSLGRVRVPVLDVSGEGDADVARSAAARKEAYEKGGGSSFTVIKLPGPVPHDFAGAEKELEASVHTWIKGVAPA